MALGEWPVDRSWLARWALDGGRGGWGAPLGCQWAPACEGSELAGRRPGRILRLDGAGEVSFGATLELLVNRGQAAGEETGTGAALGVAWGHVESVAHVSGRGALPVPSGEGVHSVISH